MSKFEPIYHTINAELMKHRPVKIYSGEMDEELEERIFRGLWDITEDNLHQFRGVISGRRSV